MKSKEELEKEPMPYDNETPKKCPKCGNWFLSYPALSRRDNSTYICPDCGVKEAMEDYMSSMKKEGLEEATAKVLLEDPENETLTKPLTESVDWDYYDKFEDLINKYMPDQGEGETLASQIVTAVNKLVYKWYNDGDVFDNVNSGLQGWANDLSSYANWLYKYAPGDAPSILKNIYGMGEESDYETLLKELADNLLDENLLDSLEKSKQGSIYDCDGPFKFREYYEDDEDEWDDYEEDEDEEDEDDLEESKKLQEGVNNLTIRTGLTDKNAYDVLSSVVGQLADGIWENSPGMSRYWQHMDIDQEGSEVVAKFDTQDYDSGFRGKDESQIKKWLANKVKQIVKEEGLDWNRDNTERCSYMHGSVTVQDAYRVYDKLLGRKDYIPDPNKKTESKEVMKKELNKDELLNKLEDYVLNQYTIFNDKLYDDFGDIQLNDKDNSKRSIYIYYDIEEDKISVTVGAAGARTFVDTIDEVAQFINAEIAKVNAQDEEIKKLATEAVDNYEDMERFDINILNNGRSYEKFDNYEDFCKALKRHFTEKETSTYNKLRTFDRSKINGDGYIQNDYQNISTIAYPKETLEESKEIDYDYILKQIEFLQDKDSSVLSIPDDFDVLKDVDIPKEDKYWELLDRILNNVEKSKGVYYSIDEVLEELHEYIESKIKPVKESLDREHDEYLKKMDKKYKTFCKNMELNEKDPDDALFALDELEGQFGDEDGEYQELREFIHNELLESKEIKQEGKGKFTDDDIRKAIKSVISDNNGIFTDDSKYDVIEKLTGITDIELQPNGLWERVDKIYETEFNK